MSRPDGFNAEILTQVDKLFRERGGLGYDINCYFTRDLDYGPSGKIKAKNAPLTMCVAAVCEVIICAMTELHARTGNTAPFVKLPIDSWRRGTKTSIRAHIFMYDDVKSNGTAHALERFGIGVQVPFDTLQPGDFINFNRENGSGHACVFLGYLDGVGRDLSSFGPNVAGFRYFSAQGRGSSDAGLGYRWAFFAGKAPAKLPGKRMDRGIIFSKKPSLLCCGYMRHPDHWPATVGISQGRTEGVSLSRRRGASDAPELPAPDLSRFSGETSGDRSAPARGRGNKRAGPAGAETASVVDYRDFVASLGVRVDLLPNGFPTRPGTRIVPKSITIHNTDNSAPGAGAASHNRYIRGADAVRREVSWHFTVDDRHTYQHLPTNEMGWHANREANASSLGMEICMNAGLDAERAYARAADLAAHLLIEFGLNGANGLRQHFDWTRKNCPSVLRGKRTGWADFKRLVQRRFDYARSLPGAPGGPGAVGRTRGGAAIREALASRLESAAALDMAFAAHTGGGSAVPRAKPIPDQSPVPFAASSALARHWPVITAHPRALEVNTLLVGGSVGTRPGRRFLADRAGGRYHVGLDLFCSENDPVVAIEDGKIVAFYPFYRGTHALLVAHGGFVVNYGEVAPNSLARLGLGVGSAVKSGQQIATVGRLNMLHFETYVAGTKINHRWFKGKARPAALRNPSQLLLELAANGIRLSPSLSGGVVVADAHGLESVDALEIPAIGFPSVLLSGSDVKVPAESDWHRFSPTGREWRYDSRGLSLRDAKGREIPQRWDGDLKTMRRIFELMGPNIVAASRKHSVNPALILMTIATEAHVHMARRFTGPSSFRWEAGVVNKDVKPPVTGDYSPGPMQTLGSTVRWIISRRGKEYGLDYDAFKVAPVYKRRPQPAPAKHPLYGYATNIELGTAEIRIRWQKTKDDPILVAAAYNTGGLYPDPASPWGLKARGDHLDRAAKWYGDACALLVEIGVF